MTLMEMAMYDVKSLVGGRILLAVRRFDKDGNASKDVFLREVSVLEASPSGKFVNVHMFDGDRDEWVQFDALEIVEVLQFGSAAPDETATDDAVTQEQE